jgi:prolyl-tRNA synthetase
LQALGSKNVQLPLFIKASEFAKETSHIDGFSPEVFTVTKIGNEPLIDPLYVRPTSEVLFSQLFKSEVRSYHDLPIKYNQ